MKNMKSLQLLLAMFFLAGFKGISQDAAPEYNTFRIESKELGEARVINVWTPPGYAEAKDAFPVLYMADGGVEEDFLHMAATVSKLVMSGQIRPVILRWNLYTQPAFQFSHQSGLARIHDTEMVLPVHSLRRDSIRHARGATAAVQENKNRCAYCIGYLPYL